MHGLLGAEAPDGAEAAGGASASPAGLAAAGEEDDAAGTRGRKSRTTSSNMSPIHEVITERCA